jgi:peptidoglycan-N-acetylglucosamine deacetylase
MAPTAVLTLVALRVTAALAAFGWVAPVQPSAPPVQPPAPPAEARAEAPPDAERGLRALRPIRYVETREPAVAITFDACATRSHGYSFDRRAFDVVKRERVPVTIFVSGRWVESHGDVMAELAADPLVEFGDHSYDHPHMSHLPVARIVEEIDQTEAALAKYGRRSVAFRPPFGEWSARLVYVVQDLKLPTVTWDVVSGDPSAHTTIEGMIRNVVPKARNGSIIVFHINGRGLKTADALPAIVRELRQRGFRFVQVSELMAAGRAAPIPTAPLPTAPGPAARPAVAPIPAATITPPPSPVSGPGPQ